MRRPLFMVCLCLVAIAALRLSLYNASDAGGSIAMLPFPADGDVIMVTGIVSCEDTETFILDSVVWLVEDDPWGRPDLQSSIQSEQQKCSESIINNFSNNIPIKAKLICEHDEEQDRVCYGSLVTLKGTYRAFSGATNPGEFDAAEYYLTQGVGGRMTDISVCFVGDGCRKGREFLYRLRHYFKERLYDVFPRKEASILTAMLLGDKEELDSGIKELYRQNGIIHILSISGLHITMIGMGVYSLLRRMGMPVWLAAVCGGIILCLYGMMTGMSVSACRAIGMYLIRMLALVTGKSYDMLTALGIMAVIMVWKNPLQLKNAGFLLSFASILGVGWLYPSLFPEKERYIPKRYEPRRWKQAWNKLWWKTGTGLLQSMEAGSSITLFTLPIQLWFYYEVPTYSIFLNLMVLPLVGIVMMTGLMTMLLPGMGLVGTFTWLILRGYEWLCGCFQMLPFSTWNPGKPKAWQVVVYYFLLTALVFLNARRRKPRRIIERKSIRRLQKIEKRIRIPFVLTIAVMVLSFRVRTGNLITFLDVGQGDGIVIETASGEVYLFDCGSSSRSRVGEYVLLPLLKSKGIRTIDAVFISHADTDHCSGVKELFAMAEKENITIGQLVLPEISESMREKEMTEILRYAADRHYKSEKEVSIPIRYIDAGDSFATKSVSFLCLHPPGGYETTDSNEYSQCFYAEFSEKKSPSFSLLLTGDVEGDGEQLLVQELKHRDIKNVTVLKVAHHGSRNSTGTGLLAQVRPELAVISCGENNRYGHPHEETLDRLDVVGAEIFRTDKSGAIIVEGKSDNIRVTRMREKKK